MPLFSVRSPPVMSAFPGRGTVVTVPGVTENGAVNPSPGIATVPVVATRPVMKSDCAAVPQHSALVGNPIQNSSPKLSGVCAEALLAANRSTPMVARTAANRRPAVARLVMSIALPGACAAPW